MELLKPWKLTIYRPTALYGTFKGPVHTGQMEGLRMDREQIPTFVRFGGVVRDVQSAHDSRTDRVRTALIALETRQSVREAEF